MIVLSLAYALALPQALVKVEPYHFGYLDEIAEIDITPKYRELCKGKSYLSLGNIEAKNILEKNRLSPYAWKLLIDTYLKNKSGTALLKEVDQMSENYTKSLQGIYFSRCKDYAIRVLNGKHMFSSSLFGNESWETIQRKYPKIGRGGGFSMQHILDQKDICLAEFISFAKAGLDSSQKIALQVKNRYPNDYGFRFYYALSLTVGTYSQDSQGKLHPELVADYNKFVQELKAIQAKWPSEEAPYCLLMQYYEASNPKVAKDYATKYLAIVKKTFRVNWLNSAKRIAAKS